MKETIWFLPNNTLCQEAIAAKVHADIVLMDLLENKQTLQIFLPPATKNLKKTYLCASN